jgi:hypothetical protein
MAALQRLAVLQAAQRRIVAHRFDELLMANLKSSVLVLGSIPLNSQRTLPFTTNNLPCAKFSKFNIYLCCFVKSIQIFHSKNFT